MESAPGNIPKGVGNGSVCFVPIFTSGVGAFSHFPLGKLAKYDTQVTRNYAGYVPQLHYRKSVPNQIDSVVILQSGARSVVYEPLKSDVRCKRHRPGNTSPLSGYNTLTK